MCGINTDDPNSTHKGHYTGVDHTLQYTIKYHIIAHIFITQ